MITRNILMKSDLILVTLLGFLTWHIQISIIPLSFILLRLFTSFSLADRKKTTWLPLSLCVAWMMLIFFSKNDNFMDFLYIEPVYKLVRSIMLLFGVSELRWTDHTKELSFDTLELSITSVLTATFSIFYIAWLLLYPIIEYLIQWKKKEFVNLNRVKNNTVFIVVYFMLTLVLAKNIAPTTQNFVFFMLSFSGLLVLLSFKGIKEVSNRFKLYSSLFGIFVCAYVLGCEMKQDSSFVGVVVLPPLLYYTICKNNKIEMQYRDWAFLVFAGMSFGIAQSYNLWPRILLLATSAFSYGYETYIFHIRSEKNKKYSTVLFLTLAFILPTLTIGYNQYSVLDSHRLKKYENYIYAPNGILWTYNPATNVWGLRDRYGEILPCKYDAIAQIDHSKPFVTIREGRYIGIYDIEKNKVIIEPKYTNFIPYGWNTYKLESDNDTCTYFHIGPHYYSKYSDSELWKISDNPKYEFTLKL